MLTSDLYE